MEGNWNFKIYGGDAFSSAARDRFVTALQKIRSVTAVDTLRHAAEEFLEKIAGQLSAEAEAQVVRADLDGALALYERELTIKPDSKNVHTSLGKFYYFNGDLVAATAVWGAGLLVSRIRPSILVPELRSSKNPSILHAPADARENALRVACRVFP